MNLHNTFNSLFISSVFLLACGNKAQNTVNNIDYTIPVKVMALSKADNSNTVEATGQMTTDDETYLSFKTGGIISKIHVKEGDAVQSGQLLASLDLTEIRALCEQARIAYEKAKRDASRVKNLYKDSVATLEQLQNTESMLELSKQQLNAAEFNLSHSEIRALKSGLVLKRLASEGQMVGPGTPVFLVNGAAKGQWILRVALSDKKWSRIQKGDKAVLEITSLNLKNLEGKVSRKAEMADPYTGTFTVDIALNNDLKIAAAGMIAKAVIYPSASTNAYKIPYEALLDANGNEAYVFVIDDKGSAKKIKIQFTQIQENFIFVEQGLEAFSQLIVKGNAYLKDGSKVRIKN